MFLSQSKRWKGLSDGFKIDIESLSHTPRQCMELSQKGVWSLKTRSINNKNRTHMVERGQFSSFIGPISPQFLYRGREIILVYPHFLLVLSSLKERYTQSQCITVRVNGGFKSFVTERRNVGEFFLFLGLRSKVSLIPIFIFHWTSFGVLLVSVSRP